MALEKAYVFSKGRTFYKKNSYGKYSIGVGYWAVGHTNVVRPDGQSDGEMLHWLRYAYQERVIP